VERGIGGRGALGVGVADPRRGGHGWAGGDLGHPSRGDLGHPSMGGSRTPIDGHIGGHGELRSLGKRPRKASRDRLGPIGDTHRDRGPMRPIGDTHRDRGPIVGTDGPIGGPMRPIGDTHRDPSGPSRAIGQSWTPIDGHFKRDIGHFKRDIDRQIDGHRQRGRIGTGPATIDPRRLLDRSSPDVLAPDVLGSRMSLDPGSSLDRLSMMDRRSGDSGSARSWRGGSRARCRATRRVGAYIP